MSEPANDQDVPEVTFQNRIRFLDVVDLVYTRATLSPGLQMFAGFFLALALLFVLAAGPADLWVPFLLTGLACGTGIILLPFSWSTYLAVPELMEETVEADPSGMRIHVMNRIVEHPWTVYRPAIETNRLFVLRSRIVPSQIFTKRSLPPAGIDAFREILTEVGLLGETVHGQRRKAWIGFVVGAALAIGLPLLFTTLSLFSPA